ncbi:MAG: SdrD B-like domain-containing protein, partial [Lewinella sp.]|uniref:SdrD B-like domain-containing protein n=1 Tax=Lewinella sp. TaxID=2004506 RepID=UPI003D6B9732
LVWEDYNGNGVQDEAGDLGINGVDVELLWFGPDGDVNTTDDNRTYTVTTGNDGTTDGIYSFCGLNPGTYSISIPTLPGDYVPTWSDIPGDDVIDSDDHAGVEFTIVDPMGLPEGENGTGDNPGGINGFPDMQDDLSFDFGAYIPAELGDFVWLDENFDAADDTQVSTGAVPDSPIEGVTVTLMGTNNIGQPVMLVLITDENGYYKFTDLAPGSYKVIFDASTALDECGPILLAVTPNVGDDGLDSDQDQTTFTTPFYDLFSGDDIETVDGGFVEPPIELGCIANLNVTLDANCSATITEDMILTGLYGCVDEFIITVDGTDNNVLYGCGEHTYMIQIVEDGEIVYTCWGTIFAEDKTDPVIDCPANRDAVTVDFALQTLEGSIDGTEPTIALADYSCFQNFFSPTAGTENNYDLITFTVDPDLPATDVYNIQVAADFLGTVISLFQGEFNPDNPCENILAGSDGAYFVDPFFGINAFFAQDLRIELPLEPGQTYTLMVANDGAGNLGNYVVGIVSDNGGTFDNGGFSAPQPVAVTLPLWCEDQSLVQVIGEETYTVNADGSIIGGTLSNELRSILDLTGYPDVTDNCGPVSVTVSDVVSNAGDCGAVTITRTFSVADRADGVCIGTPRTDECTQIITLNRPTVLDLTLPPYTAVIECD